MSVITTQPEALEIAALDPKQLTEQRVMRLFIMEHRDQLRYNHDSKQWLIWNKHYWKPDAKNLAFAWALEFCRKLPMKANLQKVRFAADVERAARAQPEVATENSDWDRDPWLLGTPDGVVDLKTGKLRPGKPDDMISKITACAAAEITNCPRWLNFINFALNDNEENIAFLQRCMGYGLTGLTSEEALLYLAGRGGAGKGTTTKTYLNILRDYANSVPIDMFTQGGWHQEYYRAKLAGYRVILAAEPEKGATWSEAFVNEVSGGDPLSGRHPAGRPFTFDPTHKLILQGNSIPDLKSVASGLRRRLKILRFDHTPLVPDPKLKEILREEYPGILRWIIDGCLAWQRDGLKPPDAVKEAVSDYFAHQDVFSRWVEECCDRIPTAAVTPNILRQNYNKWAEKNGERTMNSNEFHDAVANFPDPNVSQVKIHGKRMVKGLVVSQTKQKDLGDNDPPVDDAIPPRSNGGHNRSHPKSRDEIISDRGGANSSKPFFPLRGTKCSDGVPCIQCHVADGNVYKVKDGRLAKDQGHYEALHVGCAEDFYTGKPSSPDSDDIPMV